MNIEDVQSVAISLLQAEPALIGVPIVRDDESMDLARTDRSNALSTKGMALTVVAPVYVGDPEMTSARPPEWWADVAIAVIIEENPAVNRATGGTQINSDKMGRIVFGALVGKPLNVPNQERFMPAPGRAFTYLGQSDGTNHSIVTFVTKSIICQN